MRKALPVAVVGLLLTFLSAAIYVAGWDFVEAVSRKAFDGVLRRTAVAPRSGRVAIVDIDDASLAELGQWPWPRYLVARLVERLFEAGPAVVAFDVVFAEPDRTSPAAMQADLARHFGWAVDFTGIPEGMRDYDAMLARAFEGRRVVLGCAMAPAGPGSGVPAGGAPDPFHDGSRVVARGPAGLDASQFLEEAGSLVASTPVLRRAATTAFFNTSTDADNIVRTTPLVWSLGGSKIYPSLALEALRLDRGAPSCMVEFDAAGAIAVSVRELRLPCTAQGHAIVNYRAAPPDVRTGFSRSFPTYRAMDVIGGRVPGRSLAGRIVFVGTSAAGLRDLKATPVTSLFSGVEVHATVVDNALAGDVLRPAPYGVGVECAVLVLAGLALTAAVSRLKSWVAFLVAAALVAVPLDVSVKLLTVRHVVFNPMWPVATVAGLYPVLTMLKFWQEERQRRRTRAMFGTMVSNEVLRYLDLHPGSFSLTGERVEATMFFSDIAGFTGMSERMEPEQVSDLLNRYLTPMTEIVMQHGGYVDKFEGDAIMAEWGVPFRMDDHAVRACLAAVNQMRKLDELRPGLKEQFGVSIHVRVGINTGIVTAGNMGATRRFSYTVIGDNVNLAARLEPANKDYGTRVIVSESTREAARHHIETRLLDRLRVVGRRQPVLIYELLGMKGDTEAGRKAMVAHYEAALRRHWDRAWEEALAHLEAALAADPADGPSRALKARVEAYRSAPPPPDWTGEYVRASKD